MASRGRRSGADVVTTRPTKDVLEATARFRAAREQVWAVLWDPATSKAIWPETVHSVVLPGTGPGVGEIHVHVEPTATGGLSIGGVLVEACRYPEFVRYRGLDDTPVQTSEITYTSLAPEHTAVRWVMTLDWDAGVSNAAIDGLAEYDRVFIFNYLRGAARILGVAMELDGCWRLT